MARITFQGRNGGANKRRCRELISCPICHYVMYQWVDLKPGEESVDKSVTYTIACLECGHRFQYTIHIRKEMHE